MKTKAEILEEQLLNIVDGQMLNELEEGLKEAKRLMSFYRCASMEIETKFRVLSEQYSLEYERNPIDMIKTRIKAPQSILEKLKRKGYPMSLESIEQNLFDIAGVRVICSFTDDIYRMADCLIGQDDVKLIACKDYIKNPKPNGYRSLHLIVEIPIFLHDQKRMMKVEVQLRTIAMEFWASLEHRLRYKKNLSEELSAKIAEELENCASVSASLDERMLHVKQLVEDEQILQS